MNVFEGLKIFLSGAFFLSFLFAFPLIWLGLLRTMMKVMNNGEYPKPFDWSAQNMERASSLMNKIMFVDTSHGWPKIIERMLMLITFFGVMLALTFAVEHVIHLATDLPKSQLLRGRYG